MPYMAVEDSCGLVLYAVCGTTNTVNSTVAATLAAKSSSSLHTVIDSSISKQQWQQVLPPLVGCCQSGQITSTTTGIAWIAPQTTSTAQAISHTSIHTSAGGRHDGNTASATHFRLPDWR
jgi:hypothetical protein